MRAQLLQSCLTLCDPMDCCPPGSSVPGILQTRVLESVAITALLILKQLLWLPQESVLPFLSELKMLSRLNKRKEIYLPTIKDNEKLDQHKTTKEHKLYE